MGAGDPLGLNSTISAMQGAVMTMANDTSTSLHTQCPRLAVHTCRRA